MYLPGLALSSATSSATRVHLEVGIDREHARLGDELRDRRDVLARIVGQIRKQQRVDGERAADAHADGGAVGRGLGHRVGGDIAAGARLVLDHEGALWIFLRQALGDERAPRCRASSRRRTGRRMRTVFAGQVLRQCRACGGRAAAVKAPMTAFEQGGRQGCGHRGYSMRGAPACIDRLYPLLRRTVMVMRSE